MKETIEVGLGKITPEGEDKGDAIKASKPGEETAGEVEGHALYWTSVICPHCGNLNRILADTDRYIRYECAYYYHTFTF